MPPHVYGPPQAASDHSIHLRQQAGRQADRGQTAGRQHRVVKQAGEGRGRGRGDEVGGGVSEWSAVETVVSTGVGNTCPAHKGRETNEE